MANPSKTGNFWALPQKADLAADSQVYSVPLKAASARFLGETWARLVALKGSADEALMKLDAPDPGPLVALRREALSAPHLAPGRRAAAGIEEEAHALSLSLIEDFRALGSSGLIVARGLFAGTGERQAVPQELWGEARFGFAANTIETGAFAWRAVTIELSSPARAASGASGMRAWLEARRLEHGDELKKALRPAAEAEFGEVFTVRAFNAAYAACYRRARGRPRRG